MRPIDLAADRLEQIGHVAAAPGLRDRLNEATVGVILGGLGSGLQLPALLSPRGLPPAKGRELADAILAQGRATLRNLTDALLPGREPGARETEQTDITNWYHAMVEAVLPIHVGAATAIAGHLAIPDDVWAHTVAASLVNQVDYLDGFKAAIDAGSVLPGPAAAARAALYAWSAWGTAQNAWRAVQSLYYDEERRVLGEVKTHHCHDCPSYAHLGWQPVGTLPEIGDSECEFFCRCWLEYRKRSKAARPIPSAHLTATSGLPAEPPVGPPSPSLPPLDVKQVSPKVPPAAMTVEPGERLAETVRRIFGRDLSPAELADVGGAPAGSTVKITLDAHLGQGHERVKIHWRLPGGAPDEWTAARTFYRGPKGGPAAVNENFQLPPGQQGQGHAVESLGRQIDALRRAGADRIETTAVRDDDAGRIRVGYKVWPKFGYDGPIPAAVKINLPPALRGAVNVGDLYKTEAGKAWWEIHGDTFEARFDLTPGSNSLKRWDAYQAARGAATSPISPLISKSR